MEGIRNRNNNHKQEVNDNYRNTALQNSPQGVPTDSKKQTLGNIIEHLYTNWKVTLCGVVSLLIFVMLLNVYRDKLQLENSKVQQEIEELRLKNQQGERELEALKLEKEQKTLDFENQERSREYDLKIKQTEFDKEKEIKQMKAEHEKQQLEVLKLQTRELEIKHHLKQMELEVEQNALDFENQESSRAYDFKVKHAELDNEKENRKLKELQVEKETISIELEYQERIREHDLKVKQAELDNKKENRKLKELQVEKETKSIEFENQQRIREHELKVKQEYENMEKERMKYEHSQFIMNHKTENVKIVTDTMKELNKATVITRTQHKNGIFSSESQTWEEVNRLRIDQKTEQDLNRLLESIEDDDQLLIEEQEDMYKGRKGRNLHLFSGGWRNQ